METKRDVAKPTLPAALFSAAQLLSWRNRGAIATQRFPESVIFTHQGWLLRSLAARWRGRALRGASAEVRWLRGTKQRVAIAAGLGIGAPATAVLVEELAALGVRRIACIDVAASISAGLRSGSIVLATSAFAADGTSPHYLPTANDRIVAANETLAGRLSAALEGASLPFVRGRVASTDAVFRETPALIEELYGTGGVALDMETAAFYAVAATLGVEACSVLVAADELFEGVWRPPVDMAPIRATLLTLAGIARGCLLA